MLNGNNTMNAIMNPPVDVKPNAAKIIAIMMWQARNVITQRVERGAGIEPASLRRQRKAQPIDQPRIKLFSRQVRPVIESLFSLID